MYDINIPNGFTIMKKDIHQMKVTWDDKLNIRSEWLTEDWFHSFILPQMYPENITMGKMLDWLETRTVSRTRIGLDVLLRDLYKIDEYSPLLMTRLDHGVIYGDFTWIKWDGEDLTYDDIRVR